MRERRRLLGDRSPVGYYYYFLSRSSSRGLLESDIIVLLPICDHVFYLIVRLLRVLVVKSRDKIFSKGLSFGEIISDGETRARGSHSVVSFKVQRITLGCISI